MRPVEWNVNWALKGLYILWSCGAILAKRQPGNCYDDRSNLGLRCRSGTHSGVHSTHVTAVAQRSLASVGVVYRVRLALMLDVEPSVGFATKSPRLPCARAVAMWRLLILARLHTSPPSAWPAHKLTHSRRQSKPALLAKFHKFPTYAIPSTRSES